MSEHNIDYSKITDFELSLLIIERDSCHYKAQQITELLNKIGVSKGITNSIPYTAGAADFSNLPWKSYKTKETAFSDEAAWIFSNQPNAENLLTQLKSTGGKVRIGDFEYQLQGKEGQFIARKPSK